MNFIIAISVITGVVAPLGFGVFALLVALGVIKIDGFDRAGFPWFLLSCLFFSTGLVVAYISNYGLSARVAIDKCESELIYTADSCKVSAEIVKGSEEE